LYDAQLALAAEKDALQSLLHMICDASVWISGDGMTIARSDESFDALMGRAMTGQCIFDCLPSSSMVQLQKILNTQCNVKRSPVTLFQSSLVRPQVSPALVDLFIVDQLVQDSAVAAQSMFLLGVRLREPHGVEPAEAALPTDHTGAGALVELGESALSPRCALSQRFASSTQAPSSTVEVAQSTIEGAPSTVQSVDLNPVVVRTCSRVELEDHLLIHMARHIASPSCVGTIRHAITLICEHAKGGTLLVVAPKEAFNAVFQNRIADCGSSLCTADCDCGPSLCTADGGYMRQLLRGIHLSDDRFIKAIEHFTEHSDSDRWPQDHVDVAARGQPKDGAFLIDTSGYRVACATKVLGISSPKKWHNVGTRHEAALSCAWYVRAAIALVRSDNGGVHGIIRRNNELVVLGLDTSATHKSSSAAWSAAPSTLPAAQTTAEQTPPPKPSPTALLPRTVRRGIEPLQ